jgi:glycosyltransferase involved in cell wall biosynthesis
MDLIKPQDPLVSIIVITYNSSKYIIETLESAKQQTYQNIELIVTDDCSSDNTVSICKKWIEENKERFVQAQLLTVEQNTGIPKNANRGLKHAQGEWIKLIGGDDILNPECIKKNTDFITKEKGDLIFSDMEWFGNNFENRLDPDKLGNERIKFGSLDTMSQLKYYCRYPMFLYSPSWFINHECLKSVNYFDEDFIYFEDQSLIFIWLNKEFSIKYLRYPTVRYRRHNEAIGGNIDIIYLKELELLFRKYRWPKMNKLNIKNIIFTIDFYMFLVYEYIGLKDRRIRYIGKVFNILRPVRLFKINVL